MHFFLSLSQKKIDYISFEALCCVSVRSVRVRIVSIFHFFFALFSLSLLLFHLAVVYACVSVCSTWNSRLLIEVSLREFRALLIVFILCCLVCGWLFFSLHSALFLLLRCVWHSICTIYFSRSIVFVFLSLSSQYMATINDENAFLVFPSIACSVLANNFFFVSFEEMPTEKEQPKNRRTYSNKTNHVYAPRKNKRTNPPRVEFYLTSPLLKMRHFVCA